MNGLRKMIAAFGLIIKGKSSFKRDESEPLHKDETKDSLHQQDELVGLWENDLNDGSGLHGIWGWSFRFNPNGTGLYSYWSQSKLQNQDPFTWERLTGNSIKVKLEKDEWSIIEYSTTIVDAPYAGKLIKLTDINYEPDDHFKEGFWDYPGAIFRAL